MGLRERKVSLGVALKAHQISGRLTPAQAETFRLMYAKARSEREQDEVTRAIHSVIDGWKTDTDRFSRVLRRISSLEDEDDPAIPVPPHARPW